MSTHVLFGYTSVGFYTATSSFGMRALMTLYIPRETVVEFTMFISNPPSWISCDVHRLELLWYEWNVYY